MTPMQQMFLGLGAADRIYVDDVFDTRSYKGTQQNDVAYVNGIDNSTEGGLLWVKARTASTTLRNYLHDTVRGAGKRIVSDGGDAESTAAADLTSFNSNGYTLGGGAATNSSQDTFAAWNFRRAPGFFDIQAFTGNASMGRTVSHNLGCVPGMVIVKNLSDNNENWCVYHRGANAGEDPEDYFLQLNESFTESDQDIWADTAPTSSVFSTGDNGKVNGNNKSYIAYVFAGGESSAATASSVDFSGSNEWLIAGSSSDYSMGTGDFTVEGWVRKDGSGGGSNPGIFQISSSSTGVNSSDYQNTIALGHDGSQWAMYGGGSDTGSGSSPCERGQWYHFAYCRSSGVSKTFINGVEKISKSDTVNYTGTYISIGAYYSSTFVWEGLISNFRVIKGTALYTSSFRPPTEPLTNVTNTELLCCNDSTSETGSTVVSGSITTQGSPTARTFSPFDDPEGFKFGSSGSENVVKCGSYRGSGSAPLEVYVGWEPQWILIKATTGGVKYWTLFDQIRGMVTGGNDNALFPNASDAEQTGFDRLRVTPTGFQLDTVGGYNDSGVNYAYTCIRRADGYVGKKLTATDVFAIDTGNGSSTIPVFDSGFPVDYAFMKEYDASGDWYSFSRLTAKKQLIPNKTDVEGSATGYTFDSNTGYGKNSDSSAWQSWMWRRWKGMDLVTYDGNSVSGRPIRHSLNAVPQMIWIKRRNDTKDWTVGNDQANGGTTPWNYYLELNGEQAESSQEGIWNNTAPTSTHFTLGNWSQVNNSSGTYIAMLFTSASGISKIGSYTGDGTDDGSNAIDVGFTPKFLMLKSMNNAGGWYIVDTSRGFSSSANSEYLRMNETNAQYDGANTVRQTSTGFNLYSPGNQFNANGTKILYYAHA